MIKLEIKEIVPYEIGEYTTETSIEIFKNEDDLKKYLLNYQFYNGYYINENGIDKLLNTKYLESQFLKLSLKIL